MDGLDLVGVARDVMYHLKDKRAKMGSQERLPDPLSLNIRRCLACQGLENTLLYKCIRHISAHLAVHHSIRDLAHLR